MANKSESNGGKIEMEGSGLPSGTVTFLFTDIEGSTKIAQEQRHAWEALRAHQHANLHSAIQAKQWLCL